MTAPDSDSSAACSWPAPAGAADPAMRTMHTLDRPVWSTLTTHHTPLAEGGDLARRFVRDVNVFASSCDDSPAALAALADLVRPGESAFLLQAPRIALPPGLIPVREAKGVQMLAPPLRKST